MRIDRDAYGSDHGTLIIYKIDHHNRLSNDYIKNLIYKRQYRNYIDEDLFSDLGLRVMKILPISELVSGNCSWANVEAIVPTMFFMFLLQKSDDAHDAQQQPSFCFEEWVSWDKNRALKFCIQSFFRLEDRASKTSKAALLAAILFQKYDFDHSEQRENGYIIM